MRALVTGGAGFIGSNLTKFLLAQGHEVIVIDSLHSGRIKNLAQVFNHPSFAFHQMDNADQQGLELLFCTVDWVFHLAGLADCEPSIENPREYHEVNVTGNLTILECAKKANVKRFI